MNFAKSRTRPHIGELRMDWDRKRRVEEYAESNADFISRYGFPNFLDDEKLRNSHEIGDIDCSEWQVVWFRFSGLIPFYWGA